MPLPLAEAIAKLKGFGTTKFDQTVEIHMRLGIDPKQADQLVRGSIVLPHGIGKSQRVVVFAKGDLADAARAAGADEVGQEELAKRIQEGWLDFDACIADARHDGCGRAPGQGAGPARLDAFAAQRHRDAGRGQGRARVQGRARSSSATTRVATSTPSWAR